MAVIEDLTEEECYLLAILSDVSGLDLAEFAWYEPDNPDGCFRAWPFQWKWYRCEAPLQIDQCVAEGTLILTERGQVPIEDVRVGDMVLTHLGRWRPVTYTWDRGEQPVVTVKGHGHPGLTVTADHKFWIDKTWKVPAPDDRWETPWFFPPATVPALPSRTYAPGRPDNLPDDPSDPTFLWLYGLYVAEGSCSSSFGKGGTVNRTTFSVHEDEVEDVEQRLRKVGLRFNTHRVGSERCFNIIVNSRPLATWLSGHGGCGARNKHLAPWVLGLEVHQREAVLDGMTYGDGYTRGSGRVEYTTTSKALAADAKLLASSLGYFVTMTRYKGRTSVIDGRTIQGNEGFVVGWYMNGRHNHVDTVTPSGTAHVYDLEVAEDHSFVAESIVVSNCARSVGKTLSITLRMFAFPFLFPSQEAVVTAPELVHLEPLTNLIENRFNSSRLGQEMLPNGRNRVTHRPFMMNFNNGARIIGRIPQRDGKGVKGIHPIWLELDEAQDYPPDGWTELIETLKRGHEGAVWRAHGVTRGLRDKFYEYTQDTPGNRWRIHRVTAMHRPNWTDDERQEKIQQYSSRDHPDYRRNVLGLHGDATNPLFVLARLMASVDQDQSSDFNVNEYKSFRVTNEMLSDRGETHDIIEFLEFPARHKAYKITWAGMDVGYTNHPSEIMVFGETRERNAEVTALKLLCRIHLERISNPQQCRAIAWVMDFYKPKSFALDKTGVGLPLFQDLQQFNPSVAEQIKGYGFSEKILVDFDDAIVAGLKEGEDDVKEAGILKNVLEYATDKLRELVDHKRLWLPWDQDLIQQFNGQTWSYSKEAMDMYGRRRRVYSQGVFHALDGCRMAVLGYVQSPIERMMAARREDDSEPVYDMFVTL